MANYNSFRHNYFTCSVSDKTDLGRVLDISEKNIGRVLDLLDGSVSISIHRNLAFEYRRIFSLAVRRYHEAVDARRNGLVYCVTDQVRSLFELMLQAFFLIRSDNPEDLALDAYNFSMLSWYTKRNELVETKDIKILETNKWTQKKSEVEEIFRRYGKRRPKFYLDLSVKKVAKDSGLERQHRIFYSMLSSLTHNEPSTSDDLELMENEKLVLFIIPKNLKPKKIDDFLDFANQIFLVTSAAAIISLLMPNEDRYIELVEDMKSKLDNDFWGRELATIEELARLRFG